MTTTLAGTPPELVFAPQVPFSWTLRGAWARRQRAAAASPPRAVAYSIIGSAVGVEALAAALAFCETHDARLELH
jgi:hypothetical protein